MSESDDWPWLDYSEPDGLPQPAKVRRISEAVGDTSVDPEVRRALEIARQAFGDDITVETTDPSEYTLGPATPED